MMNSSRLGLHFSVNGFGKICVERSLKPSEEKCNPESEEFIMETNEFRTDLDFFENIQYINKFKKVEIRSELFRFHDELFNSRLTFLRGRLREDCTNDKRPLVRSVGYVRLMP